MKLSIQEKLASARLLAAKRFPYFRVALTNLIPHAQPGLGTLGVTPGWILYYDPATVEEWDVAGLSGVLVHEVMHLLRRHAERAETIKAEHTLWNLAADAEINDNLVMAGCSFPTPPFMPTQIPGASANMLAEEYYRILVKQGSGKSGQGDGQKSGQNAPDGKGKSSPAPGGDAEQSGQKGKPGKPGKPGSGRCGGCAGNPEPIEAELDKADGRSAREKGQLARITAEAIRQHANKGRGSVPGGWLVWADAEIAPPKIPWQQKLAKVVRAACATRTGAVDYRFSRISRRQAGLGYGVGRPTIPALVAPKLRVTVVVDTSGSMGTSELEAAIAEVGGVLKAVGGEVQFLACDAEVQAGRKVSHARDAVKLLKGGGGTDFRPVFAALAPKKLRPDVVIFLTDGMGPAPTSAPPYRVIWCLVGGSKTHPCTWGDFVEVEND